MIGSSVNFFLFMSRSIKETIINKCTVYNCTTVRFTAYVHVQTSVLHVELAEFLIALKKIKYPSHRPKEISFLNAVLVQNKVFTLHWREKTRLWKNNQVARKRKRNGAIYRIMEKKKKEKVVGRRIFPYLKINVAVDCAVCAVRHFRVMYRTTYKRAFYQFFSGDGSTLSTRTWSRSRSDMPAGW